MSGAYQATLYHLPPAQMARRPSTSCRTPSSNTFLLLKLHLFWCSHIAQSSAQTLTKTSAPQPPYHPKEFQKLLTYETSSPVICWFSRTLCANAQLKKRWGTSSVFLSHMMQSIVASGCHFLRYAQFTSCRLTSNQLKIITFRGTFIFHRCWHAFAVSVSSSVRAVSSFQYAART